MEKTATPFTNWMDKKKRCATKIEPKGAGGGTFGRVLNLDKCLPEVAGDVISSVAVDYVRLDATEQSVLC